jgi:hypothetical protein
MPQTPLLLLTGLLLLMGTAPRAAAENGGAAESGEILARANLGIDVMNLGLAAGVGAGYRLPVGEGTGEIMLDIFYNRARYSYEESLWEYEGTEWLTIVAVRFDWLFNYAPEKLGLYPLAGTGFFAGSYAYEETGHPVGSPTPTVSNSADFFASGTVLNAGLAYVFSDALEARVEVPVLVFFGAYGQAAAVAIPITLSAIYRF